jgi:hypothetical protein
MDRPAQRERGNVTYAGTWASGSVGMPLLLQHQHRWDEMCFVLNYFNIVWLISRTVVRYSRHPGCPIGLGEVRYRHYIVIYLGFI